MLQKPVFALPGCQRMSVNTLLCDTLALAEVLSFGIDPDLVRLRGANKLPRARFVKKAPRDQPALAITGFRLAQRD